ncbi:hypothetical protein JOC33_002833 [Thalassobacillus pellis]|nr:hypothetical protein [Thalassobacillus pellis]
MLAEVIDLGCCKNITYKLGECYNIKRKNLMGDAFRIRYLLLFILLY